MPRKTLKYHGLLDFLPAETTPESDEEPTPKKRQKTGAEDQKPQPNKATTRPNSYPGVLQSFTSPFSTKDKITAPTLPEQTPQQESMQIGDQDRSAVTPSRKTRSAPKTEEWMLLSKKAEE